MSEESSQKKATPLARLFDRLHDPLQLRIFLTVAMVAIGYLGVYMPLSDNVVQGGNQLARERKLTELAVSVEHLRAQYQRFDKRLPKQSDPKEWVNYVLEGIRHVPLKLIKLNCDPPREMGPYKAVVLRIELDGEFGDMERFVRWLESNDRLFRADSISIAPSQTNKDVFTLQITVLGMMG